MRQALEQGAEQESRETALRMLERKLDIKLISEVTMLSVSEINKLVEEKN